MISIGMLAIGLLGSSCSFMPSHFHDEKASALSTQLQTEFATYREDQSSLYASMAANLTSFQADEEELLSRFATVFQSALVTRTSSMTWKELDLDIKKAKRKQRAFQEEILKKMNEDLQSRDNALTDKATAEEAISEYKRKIRKEKSEADYWQNSINTIQEALSRLPADIQALRKKTTGLDLVKELPEELRDKLPKSIADAPGIAVRILELGLELAELRKRRAETKLAGLQLRDEMFQEAFVHTRVAEILLDESEKKSMLGGKEGEREDAILVSLLQLKKDLGTDSQILLDTTDRMTSRLYALRAYATARWLVGYQESLLPVRLARFEYQDSITRSDENDRAWQALIASGIDALVEYHKGGVKSEDIANIIRLAQSIALYFIAT